MSSFGEEQPSLSHEAHDLMFAPRALVAIALTVTLGAPTLGHGDIPESDVACTGRVLLNDDLAPRSGASGSLRIVSARAEILDDSGAPVGTLYLDDRGERYVALESGLDPGVSADFPRLARMPEGSGGSPQPLAPDFKLKSRYRLAACR